MRVAILCMLCCAPWSLHRARTRGLCVAFLPLVLALGRTIGLGGFFVPRWCTGPLARVSGAGRFGLLGGCLDGGLLDGGLFGRTSLGCVPPSLRHSTRASSGLLTEGGTPTRGVGSQHWHEERTGGWLMDGLDGIVDRWMASTAWCGSVLGLDGMADRWLASTAWRIGGWPRRHGVDRRMASTAWAWTMRLSLQRDGRLLLSLIVMEDGHSPANTMTCRSNMTPCSTVTPVDCAIIVSLPQLPHCIRHVLPHQLLVLSRHVANHDSP